MAVDDARVDKIELKQAVDDARVDKIELTQAVDDARVDKIELTQAVHEAVCGERYRLINYKLNIAIAGIGIILTAISAGDPLIVFLRRILGGG